MISIPKNKVSGFWKSPATSNKNKKFPSLSSDYNMDRLTYRQTVHDLNPTRDVELTNNNNNKKTHTNVMNLWNRIDYTMDNDLLDHFHHLHCKPRKRIHDVGEDTCTSFFWCSFPPKKSAPEVLKLLEVQVQIFFFLFFKCQWQNLFPAVVWRFKLTLQGSGAQFKNRWCSWR